MSTLKQTPSQTVGPFFAYGLCPGQYHYDLGNLFSPEAATHHASGEHITIIGKVYDGSGAAVGDAVIETLQPDAKGNYVTSVEQARESGFRGFARVGTGTDPEQRFVIRTIKPGAVNADAAPCLDVIVLMRGMLLHTFTRIYFDDEPQANARDDVLRQVPPERRSTLIARRDLHASSPVYRFDIHMQGPQETVFFDL
ncbi:Protocatechuate 3,4-dioxygenase alpha chain [bioreactor metagenome]|uniref:Protocatechuate 3,4-dioxygenase alpha chain n=1 Tax=bioreactor metagenome TaxID=1076179 RepID=A0A644Z4U6_9ZZZZ